MLTYHINIGILSHFKTLDFGFYLHFMYGVLTCISILSKTSSRKESRHFRSDLFGRCDNGFIENLMRPNVFSFCRKHNIDIVDMTEKHNTRRHCRTTRTNQFHSEAKTFNMVIDMQVIESENRFSELSTQLLEYIEALNPCD